MLRYCNKETNDQQQMANILNQQYESVFTKDSGKIPNKGNSKISDMSQINIGTLEVETQPWKRENKKLLHKLDHYGVRKKKHS